MPLAVRPLSAPCLGWIGKQRRKVGKHMSKELETIALWRDGGGGLWSGRSGPERPWNWLTGTDASPDDLLSGESRKVEESFRRIDPDDVRPTPDPARPRPAQRPDGHLARGAGRPPRDVRARRSAEVMANLRREAQRCRPESGRQRPCDRRTRRTRSHGPSEGWLLRLRQEPRDAGMAGLLEVGARHGGLPRRIGARPQMDAGYDATNPRQGQCKPRPWVTSSP